MRFVGLRSDELCDELILIGEELLRGEELFRGDRVYFLGDSPNAAL